ncbi:DUF1353 domain-containing protein [Enterovibrio norvegicus]|uniref:DUF1353 domain-containing protein n=1 Tax=Enterovibrio norvegicus TaxID=188144 RepID=A0A2N7LAB2_9GAMM|nr:DUF1353 domain-containing protein [Enterovibrio norvegicus]PML80075.1 hypothetical protein BCT69_02865 [Enterovibrio norvegicus]PMN91543.1 hypothetical protein BCT23_16725 [Enterovibrio norvegicus]
MLKQPKLFPNAIVNKYELTWDFEIVTEGVDIVVPKYFRYDGASIPAPAWQATFTPFHPDVMMPALVHDWLYYNHQVEIELVDDIFYRLLRDNGVDNLRANLMWGAVKAAGRFFWENDKEDLDYLEKLYRLVRNRENKDRYQFPQAIIDRVENTGGS